MISGLNVFDAKIAVQHLTTGALSVGDEIVEIAGNSVKGKTVSEVVDIMVSQWGTGLSLTHIVALISLIDRDTTYKCTVFIAIADIAIICHKHSSKWHNLLICQS